MTDHRGPSLPRAVLEPQEDGAIRVGGVTVKPADGRVLVETEGCCELDGREVRGLLCALGSAWWRIGAER